MVRILVATVIAVAAALGGAGSVAAKGGQPPGVETPSHCNPSEHQADENDTSGPGNHDQKGEHRGEDVCTVSGGGGNPGGGNPGGGNPGGGNPGGGNPGGGTVGGSTVGNSSSGGAAGGSTASGANGVGGSNGSSRVAAAPITGGGGGLHEDTAWPVGSVVGLVALLAGALVIGVSELRRRRAVN